MPTTSEPHPWLDAVYLAIERSAARPVLILTTIFLTGCGGSDASKVANLEPQLDRRAQIEKIYDNATYNGGHERIFFLSAVSLEFIEDGQDFIEYYLKKFDLKRQDFWLEKREDTKRRICDDMMIRVNADPTIIDRLGPAFSNAQKAAEDFEVKNRKEKAAALQAFKEQYKNTMPKK